mgnify:CR=1 FL=1
MSEARRTSSTWPAAVTTASTVTMASRTDWIICRTRSSLRCSAWASASWRNWVRNQKASIAHQVETSYQRAMRTRMAEAVPKLMEWVATGQLRIDEHIEEGIENALPAFLRLFSGANTGKMILKLA